MNSSQTNPYLSALRIPVATCSCRANINLFQTGIPMKVPKIGTRGFEIEGKFDSGLVSLVSVA